MASLAGGGKHNLWQPRKTMRDWGRTEYRIIRNWTPREQRGSGPAHPSESSAHSIRGSQAVGGEMEAPGPSDHRQDEEEEEMGEEVRREGGGSRGEPQWSREEAGGRTGQEMPVGSHGNLAEASPPANSRLLSFSRHTPRKTTNSHTPHGTDSHTHHSTDDHTPGSTSDGLTAHSTDSHTLRKTTNSHTPHSTANSPTPGSTSDGLTAHSTDSHTLRKTTNSHTPHSTANSPTPGSTSDGLTAHSTDSHTLRKTTNSHTPHSTANSPTPGSTSDGRTAQSLAATLRQNHDSHNTAVDQSRGDDFVRQADRDQSSEELPSSQGDGSQTAPPSRRRSAGSRGRRTGRKLPDSRPRRGLGSSPVARSQTGSAGLDESETDSDGEPEATIARPETAKGGKSKGRGKGRRQSDEKVRARLWQPRHTSRTARDLGELDVCLSLYHDQLREALEGADSSAGERALAAHWKATHKQVLAMIRDVHIVKALERRLSKEKAKSRRLQQVLLSLMGTLRRTNGDYQQALERAKRAQKADELSAKKADMMRLIRVVRPLTEKFRL